MSLRCPTQLPLDPLRGCSCPQRREPKAATRLPAGQTRSFCRGLITRDVWQGSRAAPQGQAT